MCTFTLEIISARNLSFIKKLTVFNKVQLICNFFPGVLNNIFVLIFLFRFAIKTRKCSNCLRKFLIFLQRESCPPFVCHFFFFFFFIYLYTLFKNEFKETNFCLQCDFLIFLYNFWSKVTSLSEWIISSWSNMLKNVGFLWWRVLASARYQKFFIFGAERSLALVNDNER